MNDFETEQLRISSSLDGLIVTAKLLQLSTLAQALTLCRAIVVDESLLLKTASMGTKTQQ
ncbi:MAG: hypothetical protein ABJO09_00885 [Hyphomicrobiales bacterium]